MGISDRTALVAGATGVVGRTCLRTLLRNPHYSRVIAVTRRGIETEDKKLEQKIIDFDTLADVDLGPVDDVYCSLGANMLGSRKQLEIVDRGYPAELAKKSHEAGAKNFVLVTSVAADKRSSLLYLQVKAQAEEEVRAVPFDGCYLVRPSFIVGPPSEGLLRNWLLGTLAQTLTPVLIGHRRVYRPIRVDELVDGMIAAALKAEPGVHTLHRDQLRELARP